MGNRTRARCTQLQQPSQNLSFLGDNQRCGDDCDNRQLLLLPSDPAVFLRSPGGYLTNGSVSNGSSSDLGSRWRWESIVFS